MMTSTTVDGEDRVLAAAQQIVKSLNTSKALTDDMLSIFSNFDNRLSNITSLISDQRAEDHKLDNRFEEAEKVILRWDSSEGSVINGDSNQNRWEDNLIEYFEAVDDIIQLTEDLAVQRSENDDEIVDRAESVLQLAMSKLEDELRHILIQNTVTPDSEKLHCSIRRVPGLGSGSGSFALNDGEIVGFGSFGGDDDLSSNYGHERGVSLADDLSIDVIEPECVEVVKEIVDRMIRAGYEKECCQVYSSVRRDVLDEYMSVLGAERLSIEEVQRIEWNLLDEKMKKWVQAIKIMARVLLPGEKGLCDDVFCVSEVIREVCFVETAKGCMMQLLNFGEAVIITRTTSEKLFRILDMYDALAEVAPELEVLFGGDSGELVCMEVKGVLTGLREAAIGTFGEFENAVKGETSKKAIQGGEIHPMCRYVMNYVKLLVEYNDLLNGLLVNIERIGSSPSNASKVALKERFKIFNAFFEDIYRIQTSWKVPDAQLWEELKISISENVVTAYRSFVGRFGSQLESGTHVGKYIKYTPEDLENYLLHLFEGADITEICQRACM